MGRVEPAPRPDEKPAPKDAIRSSFDQIAIYMPLGLRMIRPRSLQLLGITRYATSLSKSAESSLASSIIS
jgi:hypothetical protein